MSDGTEYIATNNLHRFDLKHSVWKNESNDPPSSSLKQTSIINVWSV